MSQIPPRQPNQSAIDRTMQLYGETGLQGGISPEVAKGMGDAVGGYAKSTWNGIKEHPWATLASIGAALALPETIPYRIATAPLIVGGAGSLGEAAQQTKGTMNDPKKEYDFKQIGIQGLMSAAPELGFQALRGIGESPLAGALSQKLFPKTAQAGAEKINITALKSGQRAGASEAERAASDAEAKKTLEGLMDNIEEPKDITHWTDPQIENYGEMMGELQYKIQKAIKGNMSDATGEYAVGALRSKGLSESLKNDLQQTIENHLGKDAFDIMKESEIGSIANQIADIGSKLREKPTTGFLESLTNASKSPFVATPTHAGSQFAVRGLMSMPASQILEKAKQSIGGGQQDFDPNL